MKSRICRSGVVALAIGVAALTVPPAAGPTVAQAPVSPGPLVIGTLLPETGDLAFVGVPMGAGARLAIEDINATGGVFGEPVELILGDSGTDPTVAAATVDNLLAEGSDVIVGAARSTVSFSVIDQIVGSGVIQFSPSNTLSGFTNYPDDGLYFRTSPSNTLQGELLAELVVAEGDTAVVVYRDDDYGNSIAGPFAAKFAALGGTPPTLISYDPGDTDFADEAAQVAALAPDAVLLASLDEAAALIEALHTQGVGPSFGNDLWGVDGFVSGVGALVTDPSILTGLRGSFPGTDLATIPGFADRLDAVIGGSAEPYTYGAETYDAVVIAALAAQVAGSGDPTLIADEIVGVTRYGEVCTSFAQCSTLVAAGVNIDYEGLGGSYEFNNCGDPTTASFKIVGYDGGSTPTDLAIVFPIADPTGPFACQQPDTLADVLESIIPQGGPGSAGLEATLAAGNYRAFINQVEAKCCLPSPGKLFTRDQTDLLIELASKLM